MSSPALEALQKALVAEHAAVFVYGALGARTSRSAEPTLSARIVAAYQAHQQQRDALISTITAAGADPAVPDAGYALGALDTPDRVRRRARDLEDACTATYAYLVANTTGARRRAAITALTDGALRGLTFGSSPAELPGL